MMFKSALIATLLLLATFISGCIISTCGLGGGISTQYDDEFVIDRPFEPLSVTKGDTVILRPATYVHINYTYTGSSSCDGKDYKDGPSYVRPTVLNDTLASVDEFYDYESEPIWRGTEMKVKIIGKEVGQTILVLEIEWSVKTRDYILDQSREFDIELTVTEPN